MEAGRITQLHVDRRRCCVAPSSADSDCGGKRQKRRNNPSKEKKSFGDCMTLQFGTVGVFSFFTLRVDSWSICISSAPGRAPTIAVGVEVSRQCVSTSYSPWQLSTWSSCAKVTTQCEARCECSRTNRDIEAVYLRCFDTTTPVMLRIGRFNYRQPLGKIV